MKTQSLRSFRCSLALLVAGLAPAVGCDHEAELDDGIADLEEAELDAEPGDIEDDPAAAPIDHAPVEVLTEIDDPSAAAIVAYSRRSVLRTSTLVEGEVVMLRSHTEGYLGCDANGATTTSKTPSNTDGRVWRVHLVDLNNNGQDEMQFELVDDSGYTNTYLKMNNWGTLYCGAITGIGDAAAWSWGSFYGHAGTMFRKVSRSLINYKRGLCIHASPSGQIGATCNHYAETTFNMEILDTDYI